MITEVTSKNGQVTFKYQVERIDKFAQYMEQKKELTEAEKQEAIKYAKETGVLPPNVKVEEITRVRKEGKDTYQFKYKLFIPESVKPQVQAGKEFKSEYVGEIKGFTYNPKYGSYVPYTTAVPITQYDLLLVATVAMPFLSPAIGGVSAKALVAGSLFGIGTGEVFSYATTGKPMKYEQFVQSAFFGQAMPISYGALFTGVSALPHGAKFLGHGLGRATLSAGFGGTTSYILSGGDVKTAVKGAMLSGVLSLGFDYAWHKIKPPIVKGITATPISKKSRLQLTPWVKGGKKTSFATTLGRAIKDSKSGMAGFVRQQAIPQTYLLTKPLTQPIFIPYRTIPQQMPLGLTAFLGGGVGTVLAQMTLPKPVQRLTQVQTLKQIQQQEQRQVQLLRQIQPQAQQQMVAQAQSLKQIQKQQQLRLRQLPRLEMEPLRKRRKRGPFLGAWFKKVHPIKTHKEMREQFFGSTKRKRKNKKEMIKYALV